MLERQYHSKAAKIPLEYIKLLKVSKHRKRTMSSKQTIDLVSGVEQTLQGLEEHDRRKEDGKGNNRKKVRISKVRINDHHLLWHTCMYMHCIDLGNDCYTR